VLPTLQYPETMSKSTLGLPSDFKTHEMSLNEKNAGFNWFGSVT